MYCSSFERVLLEVKQSFESKKAAACFSIIIVVKSCFVLFFKLNLVLSFMYGSTRQPIALNIRS